MRFALVLAALSAFPVAQAGRYDDWKPHRYCNDLDGIDATKIPPLTAEQAETVESLEQVQIIARHGGRAPYYRLFCWDEPKHNPMNAEWNCTTTSVSSQNIGYDEPEKGYGRLYKKNYLKGHNILNGDCVVGGLLPIGRQQHLKNGEFLRDIYFGDGDLRLFPSNNLSEIPFDQIYLRSDDQERTLGSGQAMLDGIFPPDGSVSRDIAHMLTWNVADMSTDYINANDKICPMMGYIGNLSGNSVDFQKHNNEQSIIKLNKDFNSLVGNFSWDSVLECLSIARCNDLELPAGIDENMFTNVFSEVEVRQGLYYTYNDSWYAKVAMQPLANDILVRLDAMLKESPDAPKLAITMGHDSTIMPFLAAVMRENWDRKWTPYAGVLAIELYKTKKSSYAARLLFHGQPLIVPECDDSLCDINDFLQAFEFARTERNCSAPKESDSESSPLLRTNTVNNKFSVSQYISTFVLVGLLALAAFLGIRSRRQKHNGWRDEQATLLG